MSSFDVGFKLSEPFNTISVSLPGSEAINAVEFGYRFSNSSNKT